SRRLPGPPRNATSAEDRRRLSPRSDSADGLARPPTRPDHDRTAGAVPGGAAHSGTLAGHDRAPGRRHPVLLPPSGAARTAPGQPGRRARPTATAPAAAAP